MVKAAPITTGRKGEVEIEEAAMAASKIEVEEAT